MQERNPVSFIHCRVGTRLEFQVGGYGKPTQGVVKALSVYGARNYLAVLSEYVDAEGVAHVDSDPLTKSDRRINLAHATRILTHGTGALVFEPGHEYAVNQMSVAIAKARSTGDMRRAGRRLVIDGRNTYAPGLVRDYVTTYLLTNQRALGLQPWELVDGEKLIAAMVAAGICRYTRGTSRCAYLDESAVLDTERMERFIRQNLNRFKLDLVQQQRERIAEEERFEREEMERDIRRERRLSGRPEAGDDDSRSYYDDRQDVFVD